jgi:gliding motility-associated protein GldC
MDQVSEIRLAVRVDQGGVQSIAWQADDAPEPGVHAAEAMILALWDGQRRNAMRIDLWTPQFSIDDMNDFVYQTLLSLADTYRKATGNDDLMLEMTTFARAFAERAAAHERRSGR